MFVDDDLLFVTGVLDNYYSNVITIDKTYDAIDMEFQDHVFNSKHYNLVDDRGFRQNFPKYCFTPLAKFREERINKILN